MNNVKVEFDDEAFRKLIDQLDPETRKEDILEALNKGAQFIAGEAETNLRKKEIKDTERLERGFVVWQDPHGGVAYVSIRPPRILGGDFRLLFFEKGTDMRQLRRSGKKLKEGGRDQDSFKQYPQGANRGRIEKSKFGGFFADATHDEVAIRKTVVDELEIMVRKIAD